MTHLRFLLLFLAVAAFVTTGGCGSNTVETKDTSPAVNAAATDTGAGAAATTPAIDPGAKECLEKMSDTLSQAPAFSFTAAITADEQTDTGQTATFKREAKVMLRRPDCLYSEVKRDNETWVMWYKGMSLTLLNKNTNTYATEEVPARIDQMLDYMATKYGLVMPLADFMFPNPYEVLVADAQGGSLLGLHNVGGAKCNHLSFSQPNLNWQIWIDSGQVAWPHKFLIEYLDEPGQPQFTAVLSDFNLSPQVTDATFTPQLPADAKQVNMSDLLGSR